MAAPSHQHQTRPEAAVRNLRARAAAVEVDLGKTPLLTHLGDFRQRVGVVPAKLPFDAIDPENRSRARKQDE